MSLRLKLRPRSKFSFSTRKTNTASFILLGICLLISACQQTQVEFTETQPPKLANFHGAPTSNKEEGSSQINEQTPAETSLSVDSNTDVNKRSKSLPIAKVKLQLPKNNTQAESMNLTTLGGKPFRLHRLPNVNTGLNRLNLVAISPKRPFQEINILATTLKEASLHLATKSTVNCIDSLKSHVTMHVINSEISCTKQLNLVQAGTPLIQQWQASIAYKLDTDKISRTVKLNKHIGAFSGAEIETLWRKIILGPEHAYNQALDQAKLVDELSANEQQGNKLVSLQEQVISQSQWHLLATTTESLTTLKPQAIELMSVLLDTKKSIQLPHRDMASNHTSAARQQNPYHAKANTNQEKKVIYLIDAPDTVQTQVRLGYQLGNQINSQLSQQDKELGCIGLAALLGRSYSGRLFYDLREQRGLTYGVYAHCLRSPLSMSFKIQGSTQIQHTGAFITGILDHLALIKERSAPQQELDSVSTYLIGQEILAQSSQANSRSRYIDQYLMKNNRIDQASMLLTLSQMSPKTLQHISRVLFNHAPYIVLRGDAERIMPDLKEKLPEWTIKVSNPHDTIE